MRLTLILYCRLAAVFVGIGSRFLANLAKTYAGSVKRR